MNIIKKHLFLFLAGISMLSAAFFAFVLELPTGINGYSVRAPFSGGLINKSWDISDFLRMSEVANSMATLRTLTIISLVLGLIFTGLYFRTQIVKLFTGRAIKTAKVTCRYCAEPIQAAAVICRHCGKELA
jgi:hypothetical protein